MAKESQVQHLIKPIEEEMGFSAIVNAGGTLHLSGLISLGDDGEIFAPGDMAKQIDRIYDLIEVVLAKCGATLEHVVSETIYVTDIEALNSNAQVRIARYAGFAFPATTAVEICRLAFPGAVIEVHAIAQIGSDEWSPSLSGH